MLFNIRIMQYFLRPLSIQKLIKFIGFWLAFEEWPHGTLNLFLKWSASTYNLNFQKLTSSIQLLEFWEPKIDLFFTIAHFLLNHAPKKEATIQRCKRLQEGHGIDMRSKISLTWKGVIHCSMSPIFSIFVCAPMLIERILIFSNWSPLVYICRVVQGNESSGYLSDTLRLHISDKNIYLFYLISGIHLRDAHTTKLHTNE